MKKGLSVIVGLVLLLTSYGCIWHRDDDYGRQREYREHEEHRGGGYERDYEHRDRDRDERRDYDDRR